MMATLPIPLAEHRYQTGCAGKEAHPTESAGWAAMSFYKGRGRQYRSSTAVEVYRCEFCSDWHIGHAVSGKATGLRKLG